MTVTPRLVAITRGAALGGAFWILASVVGLANIIAVGDGRPLLACMAIGALVGATDRERLLLWADGLTLALILVAAFTPVVPVVGRLLVRDDGVQPVDAVVVLGGGSSVHGLVDPEGLSRVLSGLGRVGPQDTTPLVLTVVRRSPHDTTSTEPDLRSLLALAGGRRVTFMRDMFATHDEAVGVRLLAARRGWRRIGVITSPSHTGRACRTFEHEGLSVACWPSDERTARVAVASSPSERLRACAAVVYELAGWVNYRIRGWV